MEVDRKNFQLTKDYYQSCINYESRGKLGATPMFPILAEIENTFFPLYESLHPENMAMAIAKSTLYGIRTMLFIDTSPSLYDHDRDVLTVNPMNSTTSISVRNYDSSLLYQTALESNLQKVVENGHFKDEDYNTLVRDQSLVNNFTLWSDIKIVDAIANFLVFKQKLLNITDIMYALI